MNGHVQGLSDPINLLQDDLYLRSEGKIVVPVGAAESSAYVKDLSKISHVLICGCSGAGKTSFVQTMIGCGVAKYSPDDIAFIIFDSKYVEYAMFEDLPHVYGKIAHTADQLVGLVKWLDLVIASRLRQFAELSVRDINAYQKAGNKMPEIFLILDDFSEVEQRYGCAKLLDTVLRHGRLTGVHCILVTSMTSTKIVTKELISNIPFRIAFRVATKTDSKLVIDNTGAEFLRIPGEMICKSQSTIVKLQSAHMSIPDLEKTVKNITKADMISLPKIGERAASIFSSYQGNMDSHEEVIEGDYDEMLSAAADIVIEMGFCSVSMLQRRIKLSYSRAARIIDQLEELGIVGPYEGASPRQVLVSRNPLKAGNADIGVAENTRTSINVDSPSEGNSLDHDDVEYAPGHNNGGYGDAIETNDSTGHNTNNYKIDDSAYDNGQGADDGHIITLRDFHFFSIKGGTVSVSGNRVHLHGKAMTRYGSGHFSADISGNMIAAIIFKPPGILSGGYFTFNYYDDANIENQSPHLVTINKRNISEFTKIEIDSSDVGVVKMFLKQLSEDIRIPITRK